VNKKQTAIEIARECGGMPVFDHAGGPVQVQGMDLFKFTTLWEIYIRGIVASEVNNLDEEETHETLINMIKYGDIV
jgi:hypothetical protein